MNPSTPIDFLFRHYEDIDQYIVDYRTYHTHRQTGGTRGYRPTSGSGMAVYTNQNCSYSEYDRLFSDAWGGRVLGFQTIARDQKT